MNTDELDGAVSAARVRVREIQAKLHRWAGDVRGRRFDDLFNLVADPAFLLMAWDRVASNRGARSVGVDGLSARHVETVVGVENYLGKVRDVLRDRSFRPWPVREQMIPKPGSSKKRRLGIPTLTDRVVQASLKLVLEPIFETDFLACSYGFRPNRRAHDAIAEVHHFTGHTYEWVVEGDIEACFDQIDHTALMGRVRQRVGDKRVLALVKAFLKAGVMHTDGSESRTITGSPQGGILSPLLANIALSVLDEHIARHPGGPDTTSWQREKRRKKNLANYRLVRYADDFVVMVAGDRGQAEAIRDEVAEVLAPMGLRLSAHKTTITHIDDGFDFLGWRIQRHRKKGTNKQFVYTYPAKKALAAVMARIKTICRQNINEPLPVLCDQLGSVLRGWCAYFRSGVSSATFQYLNCYLWQRVIGWIRRKHRRITWKQLRRRYCNGGWWPTSEKGPLFDPAKVTIQRYRYRGTKIPTPWTATT